jgi:hypothetical protein
LFVRRKSPAVVGVALSAFDDRNAFEPADQIWVSEKMDWLKLDPELPQHPESAPRGVVGPKP